MWSPTHIQIEIPTNQGRTSWSTTTPAEVAPKSLYQLARAKKLQPTSSFGSVEEFRGAVNEALCFLQQDILESGAYNGFWDQHYDGRRKNTPTPKRETDIHRQLLLSLYDWAKMRGIEVIPENDTAVGRLDVCLVATVDGQGTVPFCIEVKLAHANDLEHGIEKQLPAYMLNKNAKYGAYLVLWFRCEWFEQPSTRVVRTILKNSVGEDFVPREDDMANLDIALTTKTAVIPQLRNIRVFIFDLSKPPSASRI
jgi:hypothetical protein